MKLINEASADDQFNAQMDKIQQAIVKLENLVQGGKFEPLASQIMMVDVAASDLVKLSANLDLHAHISKKK